MFNDKDEKYDVEGGELECIVCYENKRVIAIQPCGHFYACRTCFDKTKDRCLVCREPIDGHVIVTVTDLRRETEEFSASPAAQPYEYIDRPKRADPAKDVKIERRGSELECCVCDTNKRAIVNIPCGHFYACHMCFIDNKDECIDCGAPVVDHMVIITS